METKLENKISSDRLEQLGFKKAAAEVIRLKDLKKKLMIAYEHYRVVKEQKIRDFEQKLYVTSANWDGMGGRHVLKFAPISDYPMAPPHEVLTALEEAIGHKCFDQFEVAYIEKIQDPILFGRIDQCTDRFFISQWDSDVSIQDILKDNEG